jgi:DNA-directed RNA polymerase subunit RPC12/RpoP
MIKKFCSECGEEFDLHSPEKRRAGGKSIHCPNCSEETAIKYVGLQSADGKAPQATILKFKNEQDKRRYIHFWQNNSGLHKSKSCQLGAHLSTDPGVQFETIVGFNPTNHKGKSQ